MNVHWLEQTMADVLAENSWLSADEANRQSGMRFAKRRADWRLGRWTAKLALAAYWRMPAQSSVLATIEIRAAPSGAPEVFFERKPSPVTISLSHRAATAFCAIAPFDTALGCDLEVIEPRSDGFINDYFTTEERALITRAPAAQRAAISALLWSAKESALKALRTGLRLDTRCVTVSLLDLNQTSSEEWPFLQDPPFDSRQAFGSHRWLALRVGDSSGRVFHGWWQRSGDLLRTLVAAPAPDPPMVLNLPSRERHGHKEATDETTIHSAA